MTEAATLDLEHDTDEAPKPKRQEVMNHDGHAPLAAGDMTPMAMLDRAVARGADIATLDKLMDLQERWEGREARKAFDEAVSAAKGEIPVIVANATGHNNAKYANFAAIAKVVDPILGRHGLSYRFRTSQDDKIAVTCILSHRAGHSEESTLVGPPDTSGNKNAIQAIGSTLTYLQRYSLRQALGLASAEDDDGNAVTGPISDEQLAALEKLIDDVEAEPSKILGFAKVATLEDIPAKDYERVVGAIKGWARKAGKLKEPVS